MKATGMFRVSFNKHHPVLVWTIAFVGPDQNAVWSVAARGIGFDGVRVTTCYLRRTYTDELADGNPSAWLEAEGALELQDDGYALIRPVLQ